MTEEPATPQEIEPVYEWDFFLAHSNGDLNAAKNLFDTLNSPAKVFLDDKCLLPGDNWDFELPKAQSSSLISIVLVTLNTENAYYQREEIAAAIQMARADPRTHRVIPIYLSKQQVPKNLPYGLSLKHSLYVPETGDLTETRDLLLKTLAAMKQSEVKKEQVVKQQQTAAIKISDDNSNLMEILRGLVQATIFNHTILFTLIGLFMLILMLLIIGLIILPKDIKESFIYLLGSFATAILFFILRIISRSLNNTEQIAQGRINGG